MYKIGLCLVLFSLPSSASDAKEQAVLFVSGFYRKAIGRPLPGEGLRRLKDAAHGLSFPELRQIQLQTLIYQQRMGSQWTARNFLWQRLTEQYLSISRTLERCTTGDLLARLSLGDVMVGPRRTNEGLATSYRVGFGSVSSAEQLGRVLGRPVDKKLHHSILLEIAGLCLQGRGILLLEKTLDVLERRLPGFRDHWEVQRVGREKDLWADAEMFQKEIPLGPRMLLGTEPETRVLGLIALSEFPVTDESVDAVLFAMEDKTFPAAARKEAIESLLRQPWAPLASPTQARLAKLVQTQRKRLDGFLEKGEIPGQEDPLHGCVRALLRARWEPTKE